MLFTQTSIALLSVASVALAAHEQPSAHNLVKRATAAEKLLSKELKELKSLPAQNKKESKAIKSSKTVLSKKQHTLASKLTSIDKKSKVIATRVETVNEAKATFKADVSSLKASLAAFTSSAQASLSSAASSVASAASSVSSASSSAASSISSASSASASRSSASAAASSSSSAAAAASSSAAAAAAATGGCYALSSFTSPPGSDSAADVSACESFCGNSYAYVALVEPDSPPATCYCPDIDSLSDLGTAAAASKCDAVYGSTDGTYVSVIKVHTFHRPAPIGRRPSVDALPLPQPQLNMGRAEDVSLPLPHYQQRKRSALRTYLSLAIPFVLCTTLYLAPSPLASSVSSLSAPLASARAQWEGDVALLNVKGASCPVQGEPLNVGLDWKPAEDGEFRKVAAQRLIGSVQIPTVSYDDMGQPGSEPRFEPLLKLHDYLASTFKGVYGKKEISLDKVNTFGLLYTWQGSNPSLKPIVLMAHQDVVPVNPDTVDRWTHPPFSGVQDSEGWIWGRGVGDCKNTLIGILSAWEKLVEEGFTPERSIVLSAGFDEEIGGSRGALPLSREIFARYGEDGVSLILDEGFTGVDQAYGQTFARFGMAEKGALGIKLEVHTTGGHSSVPPKHTGIGMMALLLVELEKNAAIPRLQAGNPMLSYLNCAADYGDMDKQTRVKVRNAKNWQAFGEELAQDDRTMAAFLGTTQAIDLIGGGVKINALPEKVVAEVNYRIDFLSSVAETFSHISDVLEPVVKSLNLTYDVNGSNEAVDNFVVRLSLTGGSGIEPAPITPSTGAAFELMAGTAKTVFPGAIAAPSGMIANTDTKRYWDLTDKIYRFIPASLEQFLNVHTVDEHIHLDAHMTTIQFFHKLIHNSIGWDAE